MIAYQDGLVVDSLSQVDAAAAEAHEIRDG